MSNTGNISPPGNNRNEKLSDELLLAYLDGTLPPEKQHEVELWLAGEGMESDALEGLMELGPANTRDSVGRLNHKLRKAITTKKRTRKTLKTDPYTWVAIGVVLLLAIAAYAVIRMKAGR